jgi:hypothetical protein
MTVNFLTGNICNQFYNDICETQEGLLARSHLHIGEVPEHLFYKEDVKTSANHKKDFSIPSFSLKGRDTAFVLNQCVDLMQVSCSL